MGGGLPSPRSSSVFEVTTRPDPEYEMQYTSRLVYPGGGGGGGGRPPQHELQRQQHRRHHHHARRRRRRATTVLECFAGSTQPPPSSPLSPLTPSLPPKGPPMRQPIIHRVKKKIRYPVNRTLSLAFPHLHPYGISWAERRKRTLAELQSTPESPFTFC